MLVGRGVFDPDGVYLGRVLEVRASPPGVGPTLLVKVSPSEAVEVGWDKIASARDVLITKPGVSLSEAKKMPIGPAAAAPSALPNSAKMACPICGKPARWVKQYDRWYCTKDKRYL